VDGTAAYLDRLAKRHSGHIRVIRAPAGRTWPGKVAMVRAAMQGVQDGNLLFQLDSDELWSRSRLEQIVNLFRSRPDLQWARVPCRFFYGPDLFTEGENQYGNSKTEWLRFWRYRAGDFWRSHETPCLVRAGTQKPVTQEPGIDRREARARGIGFDHYGFVTDRQLRFKEKYYGYRAAPSLWRHMKKTAPVGALVRRYLPWVREVEISKTRNLHGYLQRWFEPWAPGARLRRLKPGQPRMAWLWGGGHWVFLPEPASSPEIPRTPGERIKRKAGKA